VPDWREARSSDFWASLEISAPSPPESSDRQKVCRSSVGQWRLRRSSLRQPYVGVVSIGNVGAEGKPFAPQARASHLAGLERLPEPGNHGRIEIEPLTWDDRAAE